MFVKMEIGGFTDYVNFDQVRYLKIQLDKKTDVWLICANFGGQPGELWPIYGAKSRIEAEQYIERLLGDKIARLDEKRR